MRKLLLAGILLMAFILVSCGEKIPIEGIEFNLIDGVDTVEINTQWIDAGVELTYESLSFIVYSTDEVDISEIDIYEITYTKTYNDETFTATRYVIVSDQTPPQMELLPGIDTLMINSEWIDPGVTVSDNSLEVLTYSTTGVVNTAVAGVYEIVYTATDSSGNTTSLTRYVTVII